MLGIDLFNIFFVFSITSLLKEMAEKPILDISFPDEWTVKNHSYNKENENLIENLFSQGNGYIVSRANIEVADIGKINYAGNYIVGLYNKALHLIGDKKIERDEIVNLPNWWQINFKIANNSWFDVNRSEITDFERTLYMNNGLLERSMIVKDKIGHITKIESKRIVSFKNPNICGLSFSIQPLNYSGTLKFENRINGDIYNERDLKVKHLYISEKGGTKDTMYMIAETLKSNKSVLIMPQINVILNNQQQNIFIQYFEKERQIFGEFEVELKETIFLPWKRKSM